MKFESSNVFYGIVSIVLLLIIIFLALNIYYIRWPESAISWITPDFLTLVNIMIMIVNIIFIVILMFVIFGNKDKIFKFLSFGYNDRFKIKGEDGKEITVQRINGELFRDISNHSEFYQFYRCKNRKCDKGRPSDKFIRNNFEKWDNTVLINN